MRKAVLASAVAIAWSVAVPYGKQQSAPRPTAAPAHNVFVLTGCLMSESSAKDTFTLTDVLPLAQSQAARAGEPGAVGTSGQNASYELRPVSGLSAQGVNADGLKAHVGHRVEVTVRPIELPAAAPTTGATGIIRPVQAERERFTVTEIKRVVGRCS